ncbi:MAG: hypothetical protein HY506_01100 [Candidatus Yanofskybacteria bacterium]|nr:hypothetical protein [Candidatus Yanofskybacteria bacterium]
MSDGITDSNRDARRGELYDQFLRALANYIKDKTEENLDNLRQAAESVDDVPRGLMSERTDLASGLNKILAALISNDKKVWGSLLLIAAGRNESEYRRLKKLSPFADDIIVGVDYGMGFVNLRGDVQHFIDDIISRDKNMKIYDADRYLLAIPKSSFSGVEVVWLRCDKYGVKESRKARPDKS